MERILSLLPISTEAGETATSLGARLARRNGAPRLISFCTDVGLDYIQLVNGAPEEVLRLADLAGCDAETLAFWTPQFLRSGCFKLGRETIKFTAFSRVASRGCPACIAIGIAAAGPAGAMHLGVWQLSSIRTCPIHLCLLSPLPPAPTNRDRFDVCLLLDDFTAAPPQPVDPKDRDLETYLIDRLRRGPGPEWLDQLPFHVAAQTAENLGAMLNLGADFPRGRITEAQWMAAGASGYRILVGGETAFRQALKNVQTAAPIDAGVYKSRYRNFFGWLRYRNDDRDFDVIRDLVREFVFRNFPVPEGAQVLGERCPRQYVYSIPSASRAFGVSRQQLSRRLCALGLATRIGPADRVVLDRYIEHDLACEIAGDFGQLLDASAAAKKLGIGRHLLARLTGPGLIRKFHATDAAAPLFHTGELGAFLARLRALLETGVPEDEWLPIPAAAHRSRRPTGLLTALILKRRLRLRSPMLEPTHFPAFHVSVIDIQTELPAARSGSVRTGPASSRTDRP